MRNGGVRKKREESALKSEWRVTSNVIDGLTMYGVYRLLDVDEVDHSGNREHHGGYFGHKEVARKFADMLNAKDEKAV